MKPTIVFFDFEFHEGTLGPIEDILTLLDERDVHACFNTCGIVAERESKLVGRMAGAGHEIASHGHTHALFRGLSVAEQRAELEAAEQAIRTATGTLPIGFRAPKLALAPQTCKILRERGYSWASNRDPRNWRTGARLNLLWKWLLSRAPPLSRPLEIPLIGTQDWYFRENLRAALPVWKREFGAAARYNLNLHPWLLEGKMAVLREMLDWLDGRARYVLPRDTAGSVHERP